MGSLKNKLTRLSGGKVLDVGTGTGDFINQLAESFADYNEIIGIDTAEDRIKHARENIKQENVRYELMNAEKLEFEDNSFDTVAISNSLHHLAKPDVVLSEMKRILKPDGLFIICEVLFDKEIQQDNSFHHVHHFWAEVDRISNINHFPTFSRKEIMEMVARLKLKNMDSFEFIEDSWDVEKDKSDIEWVAGKIGEYIDRIKSKDEKLVLKGQNIIDTITKKGCVMDPMLYILGRK